MIEPIVWCFVTYLLLGPNVETLITLGYFQRLFQQDAWIFWGWSPIKLKDQWGISLAPNAMTHAIPPQAIRTFAPPIKQSQDVRSRSGYAQRCCSLDKWVFLFHTFSKPLLFGQYLMFNFQVVVSTGYFPWVLYHNWMVAPPVQLAGRHGGSARLWWIRPSQVTCPAWTPQPTPQPGIIAYMPLFCHKISYKEGFLPSW